MSVLENFEDYQEENDLYLFSSVSTQLYWTRKISQLKGCISLEKFITFSQFRRLLQLQLSHSLLGEKSAPVRFLTTSEQKLMAYYLLRNEHARQLICHIERIVPGETNNDIPLDYTQKLVKMLNVYVLYTIRTEHARAWDNTSENSFKKNLLALVALYDNLLQSFNCIDTVSLTYRLHAMSGPGGAHTVPLVFPSEQELPLVPHIKIVFPELFHPDTKMWIKYFGVQKNMEKEGSSELGWFTYEEILDRRYFQKSGESVLSRATGAPVFPAHLQQQRSESPVLHKYENTVVELEAIFSALSQLLHNGVSPHDIGLTVCEHHESLSDELKLLSSKYQVPISIASSKTQLVLFLSLIQRCYVSNFNPLVLKQLIFEPLVPWKHRKIFVDIINIGLTQACYNDESLSRWRYVLSRVRKSQLAHSQDMLEGTEKKETSRLLEFFNSFVAAIVSMLQSKSLRELYVNTDYFFRQYIDTSLRTLGQSIDDSEDLANVLLKEIEALYSFEKYLRSFSFQDRLYETATPWTIFNALLRTIKRDATSRHACVHVYEFPDILGTDHLYKIVCNISQTFITQSLEYSSYFNDYLSQFCDVQENIDEFQQYRNNILTCLNTADTQLYLSGSELGVEGRRTIPSYWRTHEVHNDQDTYDIWKKEQKAWEHTMQECVVTPNQVFGLTHQQKVKLGCPKPILSYNTLEKDIFTQLFTTKEVTCNATGLHNLLSPKIFLFESLLDVRELFARGYGMNELMNWGRAYHKLMEMGVAMLKEKEQQGGIDAYLESNETLLELLFPEEQSIEIFLVSLNIHPYLKESFKYAVAHGRWNEHFKDIIELFKAENLLLQSELSQHTSVQEMHALLQTCIPQKDRPDLPRHFDSDLFKFFVVKGRADLVYLNSLGYRNIIDFKLRRSERITQHLFQLWIYHIIINAEYITQNPLYLSLYSGLEQDFIGKLYFLITKTDRELPLYPTKEEKNVDTIIGYLSGFPRLLHIGLSALQELYMTRAHTLEDVMEKHGVTELHSLLVDDASFTSQLVVRKDCYAYIK